MEWRVSSRMAVLSHLSDAQDLMDLGMTGAAGEHINFAKRQKCAAFRSMRGSGIIVCQPVSDQSHPAT